VDANGVVLGRAITTAVFTNAGVYRVNDGVLLTSGPSVAATPIGADGFIRYASNSYFESGDCTGQAFINPDSTGIAGVPAAMSFGVVVGGVSAPGPNIIGYPMVYGATARVFVLKAPIIFRNIVAFSNQQTTDQGVLVCVPQVGTSMRVFLPSSEIDVSAYVPPFSVVIQ
jgi:hypothetical protein